MPSQIIVMGEEAREMFFGGLEESSEYAVTVTAEYPSDTVLGTITIKTASASKLSIIIISYVHPLVLLTQSSSPSHPFEGLISN